MTDAQLTHDLRLACMHIARRVRLEGSAELPPHLVAVLAGVDKGARTPGELADVERVSAPSMTRNVAALCERGLVRRDEHPTDGRQVLVSITPEGRQLLQAVRRSRDEWLDVRLAELSARDRALLERATELLRKVAEQ